MRNMHDVYSQETRPVTDDEPTWPDYAAQQQRQPGYGEPVRPLPQSRPVPQSHPVAQPPLSARPRLSPASRIVRAISLALGIVEVLLLIRVVLLLLAANAYASFTSLVYGVTGPLVSPFQGVFPNVMGAHGNLLDVAAILAMVVFALLAWGVEAAVRILFRS